MTENLGKETIVQWVTPAGTVTLSTDQRNFSYTPSVDLIDVTAGADTQKTYCANLKDGQASFSGVNQQGGTVLQAALVEGTGGTLYIGEEGTVAGKPKKTVPAIAMGAKFSMPYTDVVELSCDWQQNGARTDGAW